VVDIFATGLDVYHFKAGRHLSCFDDIMDILASLEANHQLPVNEISSSVLEEISSIGSVVVILQGWDKERRKLMERLNSYGISSKVVIIGNKEKISAPANIKVFSADDVRKGRVVKL
jgi:Asp/Glu/hydantoin racemase